MNLFMKVTSKGFASKYPELHHYTTFQGLAGICGSRTLWSTNYRDLNDTKEVMQLREPLEKTIAVRFKLLLSKYSRQRQYVRKAIRQTGGGTARIAADQAERMVKSYYDTMCRSKAPLDPYVVSFCTHSKDDYATESGLLSQWRGYGAVGGGYAIVFDTKSLIDLLKKEFNAHYWVMSPRLDKVHYHTIGISIDAIFGPLLRKTDEFFSALITRAPIPDTTMGYFLGAAPLLKH
jgi:hypothetical protein